jgi:hypothetical protein
MIEPKTIKPLVLTTVKNGKLEPITIARDEVVSYATDSYKNCTRLRAIINSELIDLFVKESPEFIKDEIDITGFRKVNLS